MSRFITLSMILDGKLPEDFGVSFIKGTSMTIPGQGSDLAQIIASVVKLPPYDERDYDVKPDEDIDLERLEVLAEMRGLYTPTGKNMAEDAIARQKAKVVEKNVNDEDAAEDVQDEKKNEE